MKTTTILVLGCLLCGSGCGSDKEIREMHVAHYRTSCVGMFIHFCNIVDGAPFSNTIDGWTFEWGYEYVLRVEVEPIKNPLADGPSFEYNLVSVINKERVAANTKFTIPIIARHQIAAGTNTTYSLGEERDFDCAANNLCEEILLALEKQNPCIDLELSHPENDTAPLLLHSVSPSSEWGCSGF